MWLTPPGGGKRWTAAEREALNEGLTQGTRPYPVVWVCQHCGNQTPGPDGVIHQEDNIGDDDEVYFENDDENGLRFAYHLKCAEIADAQWELTSYEDAGGRLN
jgi:hypothetical protein